MAASASASQRVIAIALSLVAIVFLTYRFLLGSDFVNYDDPDYVTENREVGAGLTGESVRWAFTTGHAGNWHPLTWLSHMTDVQLYALRPFGHHLTSLLLHGANVALAFLLLQRLTGSLWRSALVAALFGLHPLRVESVAWISERKDLLSAFFGLLTLLAYTAYAWSKAEGRRSKANTGPRTTDHGPQGGWRWYSLALLCFALGLMSKPMLVTWPFVMLLLDWWPLQRNAERGTRSVEHTAIKRADGGWKLAVSRWKLLVIEKLPFAILAAVSCVVTFIVQQQGGAMAGNAALTERLANAAVAYGRYLYKTVWPVDLAVFYPYPGMWSASQVTGAVVLLLAFSAFAYRCRRERPAFGVGWCWFLGVLVPAIGLVQVGGQSMADRYTYLPHLGLFIALVFAWPVSGTLPLAWRRGLAGIALGVVGLLAWRSAQQVLYWHDSETLFRHALAATERNEVAHNNLGVALQMRGEWAAAAAEHAAAIALKSKYADAHMNLANCLLRLGDSDGALQHYRRAVQLEPRANTHYNLGTALMELGQPAEAREQLRAAAALDPLRPEVRLNLGIVEATMGDLAAAAREFESVLAVRPDYSAAWLQMGNIHIRQTNSAAAADAFARAVQLDNRDSTARFNLANALVKMDRLPEAVAALEQLLAQSPADLEARQLLADLQLRLGDAPAAASQMAQIVRTVPTIENRFRFTTALLAAGRRTEAMGQYQAILQSQPDHLVALNDLAWLLATHPEPALRNGSEAVRLSERACALTQRKNSMLLGTLAATYAEVGRFNEAIAVAQEAIAVARAAGLDSIVVRNEELLRLYRDGKPFHELPP